MVYFKKEYSNLMRTRSIGDWIGFLFFSGISIFAAVIGFHEENLWMLLPLLHNGVIAALFLLRKPARKGDGTGLALAILTLYWPTGNGGVPWVGVWALLGVVGLLLIFWALGTLGTSFGLAPADRGLVTRGPYHFIRHPMYLGELLYQAAGIGINFSLLRIGLFLVFVVLQVARIQREEQLIENYPGYAQKVPWRMLIGIW